MQLDYHFQIDNAE